MPTDPLWAAQGRRQQPTDDGVYDLSPVLSSELAVWPGDTPFHSKLTWSLDQGSSVNVSAFTTTPHLGSHVDAPYHTEAEGWAVADLPLTPYLGPCRVVEVPAVALVRPEHLPPGLDFERTPRLLLKTSSVIQQRAFPEEFTALSGELARLLVERGAVLVGVDAPSVDPFTSKTLEAHHALLRNGVAVLEGLLLDGVPPGDYELVALPLRLKGLDASPVRAILRPLSYRP